jgi:DNA adenine methylase
MFPPHDVYAEPFLGAGHLLFYKPISRWEWVNDRDDLLINLWQVLKDPILNKEMIEFLNLHPKSRTLFYEYRKKLSSFEEYSKLSPVVKASMAYFIMKSAYGGNQCFSGKESWGFSPAIDKMQGFYGTAWEIVFTRLKDVNIENRDFREFIKLFVRWYKKKHRSEQIFMYLDPPYFCKKDNWGVEYRFSFTPSDHEDLARILRELPFKYMLSIDDTPDAHALYAGKNVFVKKVTTHYSSNNSRKKQTTAAELVITNYATAEQKQLISL